MSSAGILPTSRPRSFGRVAGRAPARRRARFGDGPQVGPGGDAGPRQFGGGTAQGPGTAHDDIEAVAQSTDPFDPLMALTETAHFGRTADRGPPDVGGLPRRSWSLTTRAVEGRVARGISAPGSRRSRRNSLPLPGSCHPDHQTDGTEGTHSQCANRRGARLTIPRQHRKAFFFARSRLYFLRIHRTR